MQWRLQTSFLTRLFHKLALYSKFQTTEKPHIEMKKWDVFACLPPGYGKALRHHIWPIVLTTTEDHWPEKAINLLVHYGGAG